ncbi:hypothetical protein ABIE65_001033 [Constrictibacter sp. MBR-5]|jgi:hypothetical protein|uniref:hypothetical protein n=1 Tax=Constrictibacter sp. MBR-5 TaxID=3156467 RepID=UPI003393232C
MNSVTPDTFPAAWEIQTGAIEEAQFPSRRWHIVAPADMPLAALAEGGAWRRVADKLTLHDRVEVVARDSSWWCELLVVESGPNHALLRPLAKVEFPREMQDADDLPPNIQVFWQGDRQRGAYKLKNLSTGQVYPSAYASRAAAKIAACEMFSHQMNGAAA